MFRNVFMRLSLTMRGERLVLAAERIVPPVQERREDQPVAVGVRPDQQHGAAENLKNDFHRSLFETFHSTVEPCTLLQFPGRRERGRFRKWNA